ncbi:hypothetical protein EDB89DRAFT_2062072 [Lactarius sanguifluus]|nr:hypothetical protein EDB89DRAFT_2062072 [Lactarius sanguifluus]
MCLITDAKGNVRVHCGPGWVFEDSFVENMRPWPDDHSKRLVVHFEGEDVLNYGGVSREWFFFLKRTIFYPSYRFSVHDRSTWPMCTLRAGFLQDGSQQGDESEGPRSGKLWVVQRPYSDVVRTHRHTHSQKTEINESLPGDDKQASMADVRPPASQAGTGADGGVGGLETWDTIKSRP